MFRKVSKSLNLLYLIKVLSDEYESDWSWNMQHNGTNRGHSHAIRGTSSPPTIALCGYIDLRHSGFPSRHCLSYFASRDEGKTAYCTSFSAFTN